jgi:hypothetical protein
METESSVVHPRPDRVYCLYSSLNVCKIEFWEELYIYGMSPWRFGYYGSQRIGGRCHSNIVPVSDIIKIPWCIRTLMLFLSSKFIFASMFICLLSATVQDMSSNYSCNACGVEIFGFSRLYGRYRWAGAWIVRRLRKWGFGIRILAWKEICTSPKRWDYRWIPRNFVFNGYRCYIPGVGVVKGLGASFPSTAEIKNECSCNSATPPPPTCFVVVHRDSFTFSFFSGDIFLGFISMWVCVVTGRNKYDWQNLHVCDFRNSELECDYVESIELRNVIVKGMVRPRSKL